MQPLRSALATVAVAATLLGAVASSSDSAAPKSGTRPTDGASVSASSTADVGHGKANGWEVQVQVRGTQDPYEPPQSVLNFAPAPGARHVAVACKWQLQLA